MASAPREFSITVPSQFLAGQGTHIPNRLEQWQWLEIPDWATSVSLDFRRNKFIEPWALAMFTAYGLSVAAQRKFEVRAELDYQNPANLYVSQMGIHHVLRTGTSNPNWDESHQNTGLHVIKGHEDVTRFVGSASQLGVLENETIDALRYCMAELGRNVVQHSYSPIGGIAIVQYFPDRRAFQIVMSDVGRGIFSALTHTYPELSNDLEALKLAVLPHVSGAFRSGSYSGSDNAGLGLFFTKEIAWRSGGSFYLASNDYLLGVNRTDRDANNRIYRHIKPWAGTTVVLDLPEEGVADFASLLVLCRELAAIARRSSGEAGLDFLSSPPGLPEIATISVGHFNEDVQQAAIIRDQLLIPKLKKSEMVVLDFEGCRFATQSFVHALLHDAFRVPASLCRLSFLNCTRSTEEAIRAVAAYAASYRLSV